VRTLSEETLAAIGRMTVAATDLEHLLAGIGAGFGAADAFSRPGEALGAARAAAQSAPSEVRADFARAVEAAATQLAIGQTVLRRLWRADDPPALADAVFDEVAAQLWRCREWLQMVVPDYLSVRPGVG
jgi:hypothetical protein